MTLDNRVDMSDGFYLQEKVRRLESDVENHAESHRKANEMLLEERQKVSTLHRKMTTYSFSMSKRTAAHEDLFIN